jgi:transglutaminase-like putative cysteine protease
MRHYRAGSWVEGRLHWAVLGGAAGRPLALDSSGAPPEQTAELTLEREPTTLFVPLGAVTLEVPPACAVTRDAGGNLRVPAGSSPPFEYRAGFVPGRVTQPNPGDDDLELPPQADRLAELAAEVAGGSGNSLAAALAIEQHLQGSYRYSLQINAPLREDPVQWFLFRSRQGHCEFFASSMVLLLRTLGIPARLQTGYAGGENDGESAFLVRDSHAHAWVIAWVQGGGRAPGVEADASYGWRVFDPTPPDGRPTVGAPLGRGDWRLAWQRVESAWDRWVLTFSLSDQVELIQRIAQGTARTGTRAAPVVGGLGLLAILATLARRRARRGPVRRERLPSTARLVDRVRRRAEVSGLTITPASSPRRLAAVIRRACPDAGSAVDRLVAGHERHRYALLEAGESRDLRRAASEVLRALARRRSGARGQGTGDREQGTER